jgi:hypothetical protein
LRLAGIAPLTSLVRRRIRWIKAARRYRELEPSVFLVSFPKCGRTWLNFMMGHYLVDHFGMSRDELARLDRLHELNPDIPAIFVRHDDRPDKRLPSDLRRRRDEFKRHRVIFLVRDPRDVLVSKFYSLKYREKKYEDDLAKFIREDRGSLATIVDYYNIWYHERKKPDDFALVRYEDMHAHTAHELYRVLRFVGIDEIDEARLSAAVAFGSFDNMRRLEDTARFDVRKLRPAMPGDFRSYKTRKGQVGGHRDELDAAGLAYIDAYLARHLDPAFGYGPKSGTSAEATTRRSG